MKWKTCSASLTRSFCPTLRPPALIVSICIILFFNFVSRSGSRVNASLAIHTLHAPHWRPIFAVPKATHNGIEMKTKYNNANRQLISLERKMWLIVRHCADAINCINCTSFATHNFILYSIWMPLRRRRRCHHWQLYVVRIVSYFSPQQKTSRMEKMKQQQW